MSASSASVSPHSYSPTIRLSNDWNRQPRESVLPVTILPTASTATISFIFGVLAVCFTPLFVSAIIAIITGHLAQREIRRAAGHLGGKNQAQAGLIMGYLGLGLNILGALGYIAWVIMTA
jgi:xanthine/uracil permease